jgi:hypothetical protein
MLSIMFELAKMVVSSLQKKKMVVSSTRQEDDHNYAESPRMTVNMQPDDQGFIQGNAFHQAAETMANDKSDL